MSDGGNKNPANNTFHWKHLAYFLYYWINQVFSHMHTQAYLVSYTWTMNERLSYAVTHEQMNERLSYAITHEQMNASFIFATTDHEIKMCI